MTASDKPQESNARESGIAAILRSHDFSRSAQVIIEEAGRWVSDAGRSSAQITSSRFLFAVADLGAMAPKSENAAGFLYRWVSEHCQPSFGAAREEYFRSLTRLPKPATALSLTANAHAILGRAGEIARETTENDTIHARHILAALLVYEATGTATRARRRLQEIGVDLDLLRRDFSTFLLRSGLRDDRAAWEKILGPGVQEGEGEPAGVEVAIRALSDKPSEIDLLEFADYAQALADFIENEKTQTPLTIGIDGAWGSGKTTLMKMIQARVVPKGKGGNGEYRAQTVWFNAWKYDREESLWAALALEILSQVRRQCGWTERASVWFRLNSKRFDRGKFAGDLIKFIVYPAALILATALGAFFCKRWVAGSLDVAKWTKVAVAGGLVTTLLAAFKQIHDQVVGPFELNISKYVRTPDYKLRIGFLGEFERDFKFVIDAVTNNGKLKLVIFVDDLDRCKPAKPVEVIEAINHLLDAEPCVFVMGMDVRSIAGSIEAKYKDLAESSVGKDLSGTLPLGYRFLEKIIQVPFRLPQVSRKALGRLVDGSLRPRAVRSDTRVAVVAEAEHLIKSEEDQGKDLDEAAETVRSARPDISTDALMEAKRNVFARTFDDDQEVRKAIYDALPYLEANARKVKRFINLFRLQLLIANRRHLLEDRVIEIRQLSRWLVLVGCWPEIVDALNDPAFPPRLLEAHRLWRGSMSSGLENAQATQVLLKPYLDDPRVKKFLDVSNLIALLRTLVPDLGSSNDLSDALEPYLQLSGQSHTTQSGASPGGRPTHRS